MNVFIFLVKVTERPPIGKIAAYSAYEMFSWYKYLIVSLFFSHLGFWSGNLFLIAPFPDLCLLVPLSIKYLWVWPFGHFKFSKQTDNLYGSLVSAYLFRQVSSTKYTIFIWYRI